MNYCIRMLTLSPEEIRQEILAMFQEIEQVCPSEPEVAERAEQAIKAAPDSELRFMHKSFLDLMPDVRRKKTAAEKEGQAEEKPQGAGGPGSDEDPTSG